jgi:hypothetical protein
MRSAPEKLSDKFIVAVADIDGASTLVAVTVTVWAVAMFVGATYRPDALMKPTDGEIDQVTAHELQFVMLAVS